MTENEIIQLYKGLLELGKVERNVPLLLLNMEELITNPRYRYEQAARDALMQLNAENYRIPYSTESNIELQFIRFFNALYSEQLVATDKLIAKSSLELNALKADGLQIVFTAALPEGRRETVANWITANNLAEYVAPSAVYQRDPVNAGTNWSLLRLFLPPEKIMPPSSMEGDWVSSWRYFMLTACRDYLEPATPIIMLDKFLSNEVILDYAQSYQTTDTELYLCNSFADAKKWRVQQNYRKRIALPTN